MWSTGASVQTFTEKVIFVKECQEFTSTKFPSLRLTKVYNIVHSLFLELIEFEMFCRVIEATMVAEMKIIY